MKTSAFFTCRNQFSTAILSTFCFVLLFRGISVSQTIEAPLHTFHFEWANNIWGNTFSAGYDYSFSKKILGGISLGTGLARFAFDDNGDAFFFEGAPGRRNNCRISFRYFVDLKMGFILKQRNGLTFFDKFETGLTYSDFAFSDEYVDSNDEIWKGKRDFALYSALLALNILSYKPSKEKHLLFEFGFKTRFTVTGELEIRYENRWHDHYYMSMIQFNKTSPVFLVYPELFLRINYLL
jgi:hypothetical protein